jgi:DNA polymerase V
VDTCELLNVVNPKTACVSVPSSVYHVSMNSEDDENHNFKPSSFAPLEEVKVKQNQSTGFQSAGDDFATLDINLLSELVKRPNSTFYFRLKRESSRKTKDQVLIVDRSLHPSYEDIIVAVIDGEFTLTRLSELDKYVAKRFLGDIDIWGVVTNIIYTLHA